MLIDEKVDVKWMSKTRDYYESLGYSFSRYNDTFKVSPKELPTGSSVKVKYICDECGIEKELKYQTYIKKNKDNGDICNKCSYKINKRTPPKNIKDIIVEVKADSKCVLVGGADEYKDIKSNILLKCVCGNEFFTTMFLFRHENKKQCNDCGIGSRIGENHHNWKGGVTSENYRARATTRYHNWRNGVYARDNYTCQKCGDNKGGNLEAHHIFNFSDYTHLRFDIDNGITFCIDCHSKGENSFHSIYGTRNNTKEQLEEFLKKY